MTDTEYLNWIEDYLSTLSADFGGNLVVTDVDGNIGRGRGIRKAIDDAMANEDGL